MSEKSPSKPLVAIPPVFLGLFAVFLSLAWLIPNHTRPWQAFYSDAIAASVLLIVAIWVLFRSPGTLELISGVVFFFALAAIPWIQLAIGAIFSPGTAWINSLYLFGLSLAIFVGWHWEKVTPGQCLDFLFLAISLAAIVSVGLQFIQWSKLTTDGYWVVSASESRFYANMGQPNQLASLLLLSVLGVVWGYERKALVPGVAIFLILYLLFGVVLTESRTAWLNVAGILVALYLFWNGGKKKFVRLALLGFGVYFTVLNISLPNIREFIFGEPFGHRDIADPIRLGMWQGLIKSVMDGPLWGYGWGETTEAVFASKDFPSVGGMTKHSHNIILDMVLFNGLFPGGLVVFMFVVITRNFWRYLKHEHFIVPAVAVGVLLVHSMLELPLHYAYFLLPFGMILGVLWRRSADKVLSPCPKWIGLGVAFAMAFALWITIEDYFEAERTYYNVYFGKKGKVIPPELQPRLSVLTQWRDRLKFSNWIPGTPLSQEKFAWMKGVIVTTPEPFLLFLLAQNLAQSGRPDEARDWLNNMCKTAPENLTDGLTSDWGKAVESNAAYRAVEWTNCP